MVKCNQYFALRPDIQKLRRKLRMRCASALSSLFSVAWMGAVTRSDHTYISGASAHLTVSAHTL